MLITSYTVKNRSEYIRASRREKFLGEFGLQEKEGEEGHFYSKEFPELSVRIKDTIWIAERDRYVKITDSWENASAFLEDYRKYVKNSRKRV